MGIDKPPLANHHETGPNPNFQNELEAYVMPRAYQKALRIIEEQSIKPESFSGTYSEQLIQNCAEYVANRESEFDHDPRTDMLGKTLEAMLHDCLNQGIYSKDVRGVKTSAFDDYHAGIDEVIERRDADGSSFVGCALDFTFGYPEKKIAKIHDHIKSGVLQDITFYDSPFGDPPHIHGKLQGIPKVVVGMDPAHLVSLAELWLREDIENPKSVQLFLMLLRQIEHQAEVYEILAKQAQRKEVALRYSQIHAAISKLYKEQKEVRQVTMLDSDVLSDNVNKAIKDKLYDLVKPK